MTGVPASTGSEGDMGTGSWEWGRPHDRRASYRAPITFDTGSSGAALAAPRPAAFRHSALLRCAR